MYQTMNGVYAVITEMPRAVIIPIGKQRNEQFKKGFYCYVGSAFNGLEKRLERHCRKDKKLHWHIDYLLVVATVRAIVYAKTSEKVECVLSQVLTRELDSICHFGCSDCICKSHLFFAQSFDMLIEIIKKSFYRLDLKPFNYERPPLSYGLIDRRNIPQCFELLKKGGRA
jgi:Uri superfamily endonuclease